MKMKLIEIKKSWLFNQNIGATSYWFEPTEDGSGKTIGPEEVLVIGCQLETKLDHVRRFIADPFVGVTLTDREREVIGLASRGVSAVAIGNRTGTQRQAVYESIRRALSKINATRGCDLTLDTLVEYVFSQLERIVS